MTSRLLLLQKCCSAFTSTRLLGRTVLSSIPMGQERSCRFASDGGSDSKKPPRRKGGVPKHFKVNENVTQENADILAAEFAKLARKDGFDESTSFFAKDSTFEDDFADDDFADDDFDDEEREEYDPDAPLDVDEMLNAFVDDDDDDVDDDGGFLDFGGSPEDDMDARIAAAKRDMDLGRVSVPKELDRLEDINLRKLGFKREINPFGDDETPRKEQFKLVDNAMTCSACGSDFQCKSEQKPGFIPVEKFEIQTKLSKIEELQKLQQKADSNTEWSPEDEIEFLLQQADGNVKSKKADDLADIDIDAVAAEMGIDLFELSQKKVICKRCHGLQNFGKIDNTLRPGWTEEPAMAQDMFRKLLTPLREKPAVIIALVDLFDFAGSVLAELDSIAGDNPVLFAANKVDLLPKKMGMLRAESWVRRELEYRQVRSLANIGGAVRLVSCKTGFGISGLLGKARQLAEELDCDVYVVGAANAGKSTFINHLLEKNASRKPFWAKKRAGNESARKGALTVSPLPGTTLKFIKLDLGDGRSLYDTPGLLVPGTFTHLLTAEELKIVVPKKEVEPITFRVQSGKCVLMGGLAKIEVIGEETRPFLFTFYVANEIKLHPTSSEKAGGYIEKHLGRELTPPLSAREESWEWEEHEVEVEGIGWKEATADISLRGLGWVAITGAGVAQIRITVPKGIGISVRPPLMPFDVWEVASRYTGGRAVRKGGINRSGVGRK